jgi:hypothetical protein
MTLVNEPNQIMFNQIILCLRGRVLLLLPLQALELAIPEEGFLSPAAWMGRRGASSLELIGDLRGGFGEQIRGWVWY